MTEIMTSTIQIKIEAFGAIERELPAHLSFSCHHQSISDVLAHIIQQYPASASLLARCACAIGEDIVPRQMQLSGDTHLVLLSPVAGG
jgi:molybdopterin converting factor small subunit